MKLNTPPEPTPGGGPKFSEYLGKTLILIPEGVQVIVSERYGESEGVQCTAYLWDPFEDRGTEIEGGLLVLQKKVQEQLRVFIGKDEAVLGRVAKSGQAYVLESLDTVTINKVQQWMATEEF